MSIGGRLVRLEKRLAALLTEPSEFEARLAEFERALEDAIATGRWGPGIPLPEDLSATFRWLLDHDPEMPPYMKGWRDEDLQAFLRVVALADQEEGDEEPTEEAEWEAAVAVLRGQVALWKGEGVGER
jgi:hypothetical protein